ncbi:MAG: sodium/proton-translocating pyrophosphatase [Planctomycetota bacterium]
MIDSVTSLLAEAPIAAAIAPVVDAAPQVSLDVHLVYYLAPIAAILSLITANRIAASVRKKSEGDPEMVRIAEAVRQGARAYLGSQGKVVAAVFAGLVVLLAIMWQLDLEPAWAMVGVPLAGFLSGLCGWFGMKMATDASARTAAAAKESLNSGLQVAFRSGAVMGLTVVGLALLDVSFWFYIFTQHGESLGIEGGLKEIVAILISFKMGASLQALFARVGGGIFTKAADVGADLVGKVEAGIPEDDARNPATIADNVGDNVGDVAGMGADLYESYYSSIIAAISLGVAAAFSLELFGDARVAVATKMATIPIALAAFGVLFSIAAVFSVKTKDGAGFKDLLKALEGGVWLASGGIILAAFGVPYLLLGGENAEPGVPVWWGLSLSIISGLLAGLVIARWTEYCTSYEYKPTQKIARQAITGPATVIITGIAEGMKSTWLCLVSVVIAIIAAYAFSGGGENFLMGLYGVGIAAVGMLATLGITLATDAYGPIADNAGGNAEMSGQPPEVRERTDLLDAIGNTTAATGKGFAIGSAALTALALLAAYVQVVQTKLDSQGTKYAESHYAEAVGESPVYAVYEGYGLFGVVNSLEEEAEFGGALLMKEKPEGVEFTRGDTFPVLTQLGEFGIEGETDLTIQLADGAGTLEIHGTTRTTIADILEFYNVTLTNPQVLGGLFIGVMLTFLFCALTMDAVGNAANLMMQECRRQFGKMREAFRASGMSEDDIKNPEKWPLQVTHEGKEYPAYADCVTIATNGALREMVVPSLLAIAVPVATGLILGVAGVTGLLAGGLITGFAVAVFMANAGGAWDNAKKLLESYGRITADAALDDAKVREKIPAEIRDAILARAEEMRQNGNGGEYVYGKGSEDHKATVVGDTVGDPFKDTSGPSLNILIKLLSSVAVVFAGVVVKYGTIIGGWIGLG